MLTVMVRLVEIYALIGLLFAVYFVIKGVGKIDPNAAQGSWGFRLLILPGAAALWPLMLKRLRSGLGTPPPVTSNHVVTANMAEKDDYGDIL